MLASSVMVMKASTAALTGRWPQGARKSAWGTGCQHEPSNFTAIDVLESNRKRGAASACSVRL